jgi:hypothetical protein
MSNAVHIRHTVNKLGRQLEFLVARQVSLGVAFDILAKKSTSIEEMVVVEVMREVHLELAERGIHPSQPAAQADSSTRSARTPLMAFSR